MHLMTGDAEFVGGHVRSLRYRVRRASVWPGHPIASSAMKLVRHRSGRTVDLAGAFRDYRPSGGQRAT